MSDAMRRTQHGQEYNFTAGAVARFGAPWQGPSFLWDAKRPGLGACHADRQVLCVPERMPEAQALRMTIGSP